MKKAIRTLLAVCVLFLYGETEAGSGKLLSKFTIPGGITVIHKKAESNRIVALKLFVRRGIRNEPEGKAGICLLMQGLLTKGTMRKSQKQISDLIEGLGGSISFGGSCDYLEGSMVAPKKYFKEAFKLFSEVVREPEFDEEQISKQKESQKNGLKARKDSIFTVANDALKKKIYVAHPYARVEAGTAETIDDITRTDLKDIHSRYYTPCNMLFVVVGDINRSSVKKLIKTYFGDTRDKGEPCIIPRNNDSGEISVITPPSAEERIELIREFKQAYLMVGYLVADACSEDYTALKVINSILGGRMSSRLFRELREKRGLAYEISSFYPSRKEKSMFVIYMGLNAKNLDMAEKGIKDIVADIKGKDVNAEELKEVKRYVRGTYLMSHQTNASQAWYLGWWDMLSRGYEYDSTYVDEISKVTVEEVRRAAQKYFTDNKVVLRIIPDDNNIKAGK